MGSRGIVNKTFKQVREFNIAAGGFFQRKPENIQTKLGYAVQKLSQGAISRIIKEYQEDYQNAFYEKVQRVQIDQALTDNLTKAVLNAPKGSERPYLYDKEGLISVIEAERAFSKYWAESLEQWDKRVFEIESHVVDEVPEDLTDNEKEAFGGLVIEVTDAKVAEQA